MRSVLLLAGLLVASRGANGLVAPVARRLAPARRAAALPRTPRLSMSAPVEDPPATPKAASTAAWRTVPTYLTLARVAAVPAFILAMGANLVGWATFLFVAASLTDLLDGYLARKLSQTTAFGTFLDPVADKLMVMAALSSLCVRLPWPHLGVCASVIAVREVAVSALREYMAKRGEGTKVEVGAQGKVKTATQMVAVAMHLAFLGVIRDGIPLARSAGSGTSMSTVIDAFCAAASQVPGIWGAILQFIAANALPWLFISTILLGVSTVLTVTSAVPYFRAAWPALTGPDAKA